MYPEVFDALGYKSRRLTPKQKRNLRSRLQAKRRRQRQREVTFSDEETVYQVPNGQQEDRYGTWMSDGLRERDGKGTPVIDELDEEEDEYEEPTHLLDLHGSWAKVIQDLRQTGYQQCCTASQSVCTAGYLLRESCRCGISNIVSCDEICGCGIPLKLELPDLWALGV